MPNIHEIQARVAACKAKADAALADINTLIEELPEWREDAEGEEYVLIAARMELEEAADWIEGSIDYLAPRSDDNDPECCAHRRLQAAITAAEARP